MVESNINNTSGKMTGASGEFGKNPIYLPQDFSKAAPTDKFYKEKFWPPYEKNDSDQDVLFEKKFDFGSFRTKFWIETDFDQPSKPLKSEDRGYPETNKKTTVKDKFSKERTEETKPEDKPDRISNSESRETETTNKGKFDDE